VFGLEPLVSIIVPVYNVEKYLDKCVNSLMRQTYQNIEIILIDDGSTDKSGDLCDSYSDTRIHVIHQENGGLSAARNEGIKVARGDFLTFVDSDDWIADDYVSFLYELLDEYKCDISICNPTYVFDLSKKRLHKNLNNELMLLDSEDALRIMLFQEHFDNSAWGKLYNRSLFSDTLFPVGHIYEDLGTVYKLIYKSDRIIYSGEEKYYYLQRETSISGVLFEKRKLDYLYFADEIYDFINTTYKDNDIKIAAQSRVLSVCCNLLIQIGISNEFTDIQKQLYTKIINMRKGLIFCNKLRLKNRIAIILSYSPFRVFMFLLRILMKFNPVNS
jgi:glycosyltransferase involved in cell wall biosynthesis